jgi:hypothetical protein
MPVKSEIVSIRRLDLFLFDSNLSEGWLENTICNCVWFVGVC